MKLKSYLPALRLQKLTVLALFALLSTLRLQAQLTWDPGLNGGTTGGAGTWNTTTANWWNGTKDVVWNNTGATGITFAGTGGTITLASGANIVAGNLTLNSGVGTYTLAAAVSDQGLTVPSGGATWNLNNAELAFSDNGTIDTKLTVSSGSTLTVTGSGTFNAGISPATADSWAVGGATLNVGGTLTVAGNAASIGAFSQVDLAGGPVTFLSNTGGGGRNVTLSGLISGPGGMTFLSAGTNYFVLTNAANSFSGGIVIVIVGRRRPRR